MRDKGHFPPTVVVPEACFLHVAGNNLFHIVIGSELNEYSHSGTICFANMRFKFILCWGLLPSVARVFFWGGGTFV